MNTISSREDENKVSLILPICDPRINLMRCLDTLRSQTYRNLEILCIETTGSAEIMRLLNSYETKDKRFRILSDPNSGLPAARNTAIAAVTGEWVIGIDAGDCLGPRAVEKALEIANEETDIVCFGIRRFSEWKQVDKGWKLIRKRGVEKVNYNTFYDVPAIFQGKMWRTALLRQYLITFQESLFYSDAAFVFAALSVARKVAYIPEVLYAWLERKTRRFADFSAMNEKHLGHVCDMLVYYFSFIIDINNNKASTEAAGETSPIPLYVISSILKKITKFTNHPLEREVWLRIRKFVETAGLTEYLPSLSDVALYYHQPPCVWPEIKKQMKISSEEYLQDVAFQNDIKLLLNERRIYWNYRRICLLSKLTFGKRRAKYKEKKLKYRELVRRCRHIRKAYLSKNK